MPYRITCPFTIANSHRVHSVGFLGAKTAILQVPVKLDAPLGLSGTSMAITRGTGGEYSLEILSDSLASEEEQVAFVEKIVEYLSFLMARGDHNAHYGNVFVQIDWLHFRSDFVDDGSSARGEQLRLSDALAVAITRNISLREQDIPDASYSELLRYYADGLRAEHSKSKYFHWFLILEYLEHSDAYKAMFDSDRLFDEAEAGLIQEAARKMADDRKRGQLLSLLKRTRESRKGKLWTFLNRLGITTLPAFQGTVPVTKQVLHGIIEGRNSLFHSGSTVPETVLWQHLFPLATCILELLSSSPTCLESALPKPMGPAEDAPSVTARRGQECGPLSRLRFYLFRFLPALRARMLGWRRHQTP